MKVDPNAIHHNNWQLIGTYGADAKSFVQSAKFLSERSVKVEALLENSYSLEEIQRAYQEAATKGKYQVTVRLG